MNILQNAGGPAAIRPVSKSSSSSSLSGEGLSVLSSPRTIPDEHRYLNVDEIVDGD